MFICARDRVDTRVAKNEGTAQSFRRDGVAVTSPVLSDGISHFTPGVSQHASATTFNHADRLGSFNVQTNASQALSATKTFDAFGLLISSTGTPAGPFGFVGKEGYQSDASGLMLLGHRYYDASTGRFLTRDPIKDGRNWYAYCANRPTVAFDKDGRFIIFILAVVLIVAVVGESYPPVETDGGWGTGGGVRAKGPHNFMRDAERPDELRWDVPKVRPPNTSRSHIQYGPEGSPRLNEDGSWSELKGKVPPSWPRAVWKFLQKYNWSQRGYDPPLNGAGGNDGGNDGGLDGGLDGGPGGGIDFGIGGGMEL